MNKEVRKIYLNDINHEYLDIIMLIKDIAKDIGINRIALVGGFVRDLLLNESRKYISKPTKDIDLVIEGSAIKLANKLEQQLTKERITSIKIHQSYNTVELTLDGIVIDIAMARIEEYKSPGENPIVFSSTIEKDLKRRDFSINSMAIDLSSQVIIDIHNGKKAIAKKQLDFLHQNSVHDDPTRIIRAARYSARLMLKVSPNSINQIKSALKIWPWLWKKGDPIGNVPPALSTRFKNELELLLSEECWRESLSLLKEWGALLILGSEYQYDSFLTRRIKRASTLKVDLLTALITGSKDPLLLSEQLKLDQKNQRNISENIRLQAYLNKLDQSQEHHNWSSSKWSYELETRNFSPDVVALSICLGVPQWKLLLRWWGRWRKIKAPISAKDLIEKGWIEGPKIGDELKRLRNKEIDKFKK